MQRFVAVCANSSGSVRPDRFLPDVFPEFNRSRIQKALADGGIRVNGELVTKKQRFNEGDEVEILVEPEHTLIPFPVDIPLDVIFEDEDIIVVNKAAGMVVHPGSGTDNDTLAHALLHHCKGKLSMKNGEDRPGIVHRLDKDTSGLLVAAKSDAALEGLIENFKHRGLDKYYLAICCGCPDMQSGSLTGPIGRHRTNRLRMAVVEDGREAHTDWEVRADACGVSLMECKLHTGRTHQIRVHLSDMGHPIVGDTSYNYRSNLHPKVSLRVDRPLLHAWKLGFRHPITSEQLQFKAALPAEFSPWLELLGVEI